MIAGGNELIDSRLRRCFKVTLAVEVRGHVGCVSSHVLLHFNFNTNC
jgi:hypothetical protein